MTEGLYLFHPNADAKQDEIWDYTYEKWGIEQADKYIDGLHHALEKIANNLTLLRHLPIEIDETIKFFHYGRHFVFVKIADNSAQKILNVLSILHDQMDISKRLADELKQINQAHFQFEIS